MAKKWTKPVQWHLSKESDAQYMGVAQKLMGVFDKHIKGDRWDRILPDSTEISIRRNSNHTLTCFIITPEEEKELYYVVGLCLSYVADKTKFLVYDEDEEAFVEAHVEFEDDRNIVNQEMSTPATFAITSYEEGDLEGRTMTISATHGDGDDVAVHVTDSYAPNPNILRNFNDNTIIEEAWTHLYPIFQSAGSYTNNYDWCGAPFPYEPHYDYNEPQMVLWILFQNGKVYLYRENITFYPSDESDFANIPFFSLDADLTLTSSMFSGVSYPSSVGNYTSYYVAHPTNDGKKIHCTIIKGHISPGFYRDIPVTAFYHGYLEPVWDENEGKFTSIDFVEIGRGINDVDAVLEYGHIFETVKVGSDSDGWSTSGSGEATYTQIDNNMDISWSQSGTLNVGGNLYESTPYNKTFDFARYLGEDDSVYMFGLNINYSRGYIDYSLTGSFNASYSFDDTISVVCDETLDPYSLYMGFVLGTGVEYTSSEGTTHTGSSSKTRYLTLNGSNILELYHADYSINGSSSSNETGLSFIVSQSSSSGQSVITESGTARAAIFIYYIPDKNFSIKMESSLSGSCTTTTNYFDGTSGSGSTTNYSGSASESCTVTLQHNDASIVLWQHNANSSKNAQKEIGDSYVPWNEISLSPGFYGHPMGSGPWSPQDFDACEDGNSTWTPSTPGPEVRERIDITPAVSTNEKGLLPNNLISGIFFTSGLSTSPGHKPEATGIISAGRNDFNDVDSIFNTNPIFKKLKVSTYKEHVFVAYEIKASLGGQKGYVFDGQEYGPNGDSFVNIPPFDEVHSPFVI